MVKELTRSFEQSESLELLNERTKSAKDAFTRIAREKPFSPEALEAQKRSNGRLQTEEHGDTNLNHGLWICYHLAKTYIEAGYSG